MNKDLRERLEEAAIEYGKGFKTSLALEAGFMKGAEFGYKEAIAMAKKWILNNANDYESAFTGAVFHQQLADGFEADMNKLWEE